jgi:phosphoglycolate phosphatase
LAVFDFDGTLSLVRGGWLPIMLDMMLRHLAPTLKPGESLDDLVPDLRADILSLNGQPTILQMERLARTLADRGATPEVPQFYFDEFADELRKTIDSRLARLESGEVTADDLMLPGARVFLEELASLNVVLVLASGTYRPDVVHELGRLGLTPFFEGRIYAPEDVPGAFSKSGVMSEWLARVGCSPEEFVAFGDGVTEIRAARELGGLTVGIVGQELSPLHIDEEKAAQLEGVGVEAIFANYLPMRELLELLGLV